MSGATKRAVPAPLYRDPITNGATDPCVVLDPSTGTWWMFYTQRRPADDGPGVRWVHGTRLGAATSPDGLTWTYAGTVDLPTRGAARTYWAPEVHHQDGVFHMFTSEIAGIPTDWSGQAQIWHYTSTDLRTWTSHGPVELGLHRAIDACVYQLPDATYRLWFKNEDRGGYTDVIESDDLFNWSAPRPVLSHRSHEGPNVFVLGDWAWMIVDEWRGQAVFRSHDFETWTSTGRILTHGTTREADTGNGFHADVVVVDDVARIHYFTHPGMDLEDAANRTSAVQLATARVHGDHLEVDRVHPRV